MWLVFLFIVAFFALLFVYIHWVRPLMAHWGWVRPLPPEFQNGVDRILAFVRWSSTLAWGWLVNAVSTSVVLADKVADLLPQDKADEVKGFIQTVFGDRPKFVAGLLLAVSIIFMLLRLRKALTPEDKAAGL